MTRCDIAIVGAGPVGSYAAYHLATAGFKVQLLEEHPVIGEPRHCTGVLGREAFDRFPDLPRTSIQSELRTAWIISPTGERVRTRWFDGQAFVIQRAQFDRDIAAMALRAGVDIRTSCVVQSLRYEAEGVLLSCELPGGNPHYLQAKMALVASGASYRLHGSLGIMPPTAHLHCAQVEVDALNVADAEIYLGHDVAPGSFAWLVPVGNGRVRLGVTAHRMAAHYLQQLLHNPWVAGRVRHQNEPIVKRSVPIRPIGISACDRVLLVGDAAGQVKPTTGGGIYYGLLGASLAAETVRKAFAVQRFDQSFLMAYDRAWKKTLRTEMWMGRLSRKVFEHLSDVKLNRLVTACRQPQFARWVGERAVFDWHAKTVLSFLASPRILSQLF